MLFNIYLYTLFKSPQLIHLKKLHLLGIAFFYQKRDKTRHKNRHYNGLVLLRAITCSILTQGKEKASVGCLNSYDSHRSHAIFRDSVDAP